MLTPDLLRLRSLPDGKAEPAWLAERDDIWIRTLLDAVDGRIGVPVGDLEASLRKELERIAWAHRVDARTLRGAIKVALAACKRESPAEVSAEELRASTFRQAAALRLAKGCLPAVDRTDLLARVGKPFGLDADGVASALYADHPKRRLLTLNGSLPAPADLRDAYQWALLQGLLLRASTVRVWITGHVRSVVRFAKLSRLLCSCEVDADATRIDLSGPLALFHSTLKYGRALARFVPSVAGTAGYRLEADCLIDERRVIVAIDARAPLSRKHALPRNFDSKLEERLARDLRRSGSPWKVLREAAGLRVDTTMFFPDFVLERGPDRVLVEVVGFWTPEYLQSKLRVLSQIQDVPLVVAIDATHGVLPADLPGAEIVTFKKSVDAGAIVAAAERAILRCPAGHAGVP